MEFGKQYIYIIFFGSVLLQYSHCRHGWWLCPRRFGNEILPEGGERTRPTNGANIFLEELMSEGREGRRVWNEYSAILSRGEGGFYCYFVSVKSTCRCKLEWGGVRCLSAYVCAYGKRTSVRAVSYLACTGVVVAVHPPVFVASSHGTEERGQLRRPAQDSQDCSRICVGRGT